MSFAGFDHIDLRVVDLPAARAPGSWGSTLRRSIVRTSRACVLARSHPPTSTGPEIPYSAETYYAVFFEDQSGNRLEIPYHRPHHVQAELLPERIGDDDSREGSQSVEAT